MMSLHKMQRGFSLVELMVAMVIALIIMAGVINSLLVSKEANRFNDELAYIQENARYATDVLSRDIRQAGDFGCSANAGGGSGNDYYPNNFVSVINDTAGTNQNSVFYKRIGIQGFDRTQGVVNFPSAITGGSVVVTPGTDAIVVRRADDNAQKHFTVLSHNTGTATFTLGTGQAHTFVPGTYMVAVDADCQHQALFRMTGPAVAVGGSATMVYNGAPTSGPGNCSYTLKGSRNSAGYLHGDCRAAECPGSGAACTWKDPPTGSSFDFQAYAQLFPLKGTIYFLAPSSQDATTNSLWVTYLAEGGGTPVTEELASGVVDMRITYGVNNNPQLTQINPTTGARVTAPPTVVYVTANQILGDEPAAGATASNQFIVWNRVMAVRIQLLMRSRTAVLPVAQANNFLGTSHNDRFLYQLVSTTVAVRNAFKG